MFTNACGTANSNAATLTTNSPPAVTTQPASQTACAGSIAIFTAAASGSPAPTVQWQVSTDGGATWANLAGATSGTLTFTAQVPLNGYQYRAVFTNTSGTATSNAATLTVHAVTIAPASLPGGVVGTVYSQTISAGGGTGPYTYAVTSGVLPTGLSLSTGGLLSGMPAATGIFTFTVTATDALGCQGSQAYVVTMSTFDWHFADDYGRSEMCVNSTTGAWLYKVLTGNGAGTTLAGAGTITTGSGYSRLVAAAGSGVNLNLTYYTTAHRATASLSSRAASSSLYDSDTTNDGSCGLTAP